MWVGFSDEDEVAAVSTSTTSSITLPSCAASTQQQQIRLAWRVKRSAAPPAVVVSEDAELPAVVAEFIPPSLGVDHGAQIAASSSLAGASSSERDLSVVAAAPPSATPPSLAPTLPLTPASTINNTTTGADPSEAELPPTKKRRTTFSTALPMPISQDEDDSFGFSQPMIGDQQTAASLYPSHEKLAATPERRRHDAPHADLPQPTIAAFVASAAPIAHIQLDELMHDVDEMEPMKNDLTVESKAAVSPHHVAYPPAAPPPNFDPASYVPSFSTGRNKQVVISKAALEKATKRIEEMETKENETQQKGTPPSSSSIIRSSSKALPAPSSPDAHAWSPPHTPAPAPPADFNSDSFMPAFSTGRGGQLKVSAAALERAQKMMAEVDSGDHATATSNIDSTHTKSSMTDSFTGGFSTGRGKQVTVSKAALERATKLMSESEGDQSTVTTQAAVVSTPPSTDSFAGGFSTGRGKKVAVSKEAEERARKMFADIEKEDVEMKIADGSTPAVEREQSSVTVASSTTTSQQHHPIIPAPSNLPQQPPQQPLQQPVQVLNSVTPNASRKRKFVSPRVVSKAANLLIPTTPVPNLLSIVKRTPSTDAVPTTLPHISTTNSHSTPSAHVPLILPPMAQPPLASVGASRIDLRRFASACQAKVNQQYQLGQTPQAMNWMLHTSIPVEYITSQNASLVLFIRPEDALRTDGIANDAQLGWLDVRTSLLALGVSSSLCTIAWVRNHYRWIVWKLACYQRRFGAALAEPPCTYQRVVRQMHARYEREINQVKVSALKKILEGDDTSSRFLILVVAQVVGSKVPPSTVLGAPECASWIDDSSGAIPSRPGACEVELSDGWYSVWCKLDQQLFYQMQQGKIYPGQKLRIWGAQLVGPMPTTPLENNETYMKIQINSVRRAYWHSKLGVQRSVTFLVNFASLRPDGGLVPAVKVAVSRTYPMIFLHPPTQTPDSAPAVAAATTAAGPATSQGSNDGAQTKVRKLHCNERSHDIRMRLHERLCEQRIEKLQVAYMDRQQKATTTIETNGSQANPSDATDAATVSWEQERSELEAELQEIHKQVIPYLKIHLCELTDKRWNLRDLKNTPQQDGDTSPSPLRWSGQCCSFTVWRPGEEHRELLTPGREFIIFGAAVHTRYKPLGRVGAAPMSKPYSDMTSSSTPHPNYTTASSTYLQLSTSRLTNIVPHALRKAKGASASAVPVMPSHVPLRSEFLRSPLFMRPHELLSLPRGSEFDCTCLVLWSNDEGEATKAPVESKSNNDATNKSAPAGRFLRTRRLLCVGMSGDMMLVEVKETDEIIHFAQPITTPQIMCMENLHYTLYEKKLRLHTAASTNVSRFVSKGTIQLASTSNEAIPSSHLAYTQPTIALFQSWLSQTLTSHLCDLALSRSRRIMDGSWNRDEIVISTFNRDEFKHLPCFDLTGHLHSLTDSSTSLVCTRSYSLDSILVPPLSPLSTELSESALTSKKRSTSLLSTGRSHESTSHKAHPHADDGCTSVECISNFAGAICFHPSHTLSFLLDAIHLSLLVVLDDGARRWPLQLDTHAFRRILGMMDCNSSEWWSHLLNTGDVPHLDFDPVVPQQHVLLSALQQHRKETFLLIAQRVQMDEQHQKVQLADWILLILSHSHVDTSASYLSSSPLAAFLAAESSSFIAPNRCEAAASSPPPLLDTSIIFSPTHTEQLRVDLQLKPQEDEEERKMTDIPVQHIEAPSKKQLMRQLHALLSKHAVPPPPSDGDTDMTNSSPTAHAPSPLFYFTTLEWEALCDQLEHSLMRPTLQMQVAECERMSPSMKAEIKNEASFKPVAASHTTFKSVFIPRVDSIARIR